MRAGIRDNVFGGRVLRPVGSAPLSAEMRVHRVDLRRPTCWTATASTETGAVTLTAGSMRPPVVDYKLVDVPELGYFRTDKPHPRGELLLKSGSLIPGVLQAARGHRRGLRRRRLLPHR